MADDSRFLGRALELAREGRFRTAPNPLVGALLVRRGEIVGEGCHRQLGGPHAEVEALAQAGDRARGATAYVTLEPCCHHGRTPPCSDALIAAGVARVVVAHRDPNPQVAGGGLEQLRQAGIRVETGLMAEEAVRLNLPFVVRHLLGRPAVTLKWAMSLDGRIATAAGDSQWISGLEGRRWGLELREEHDAILVGSGTALADDPRLDRRLALAAGPILRVVLDRRLRLPPTARMLTVPGPVLVVTESADEAARRRLEKAGAEVLVLAPDPVMPAAVTPAAVTPASVLQHLAERGVQSLLVEGGGEIHGAFVRSGLFDRVAIDCGPLLIGGDDAPGPLRGSGAERLGEARRLDGLEGRRLGDDFILEGLRQGCLADLLRRGAA